MASKGQELLEGIIQSLLPLETLVTEYHIGSRLRLDLYYPKYRIAFEYHGRQHFEYVEHFHKDIYGFKESQARDERKIELCHEQGIVLIVFRYDDKLDVDSVFERIESALRHNHRIDPPPVLKKKWQNIDKMHPAYIAQQERAKQARKERYRKLKEYKKNIGK